MAAVTFHSDLGGRENKICLCFHYFPYYCHEVMAPDAKILVFPNWVLSQHFHAVPSPSVRGFLDPLHFLPFGCYHLYIWGGCYFSRQSWFQLGIHPDQHFTQCSLHRIWISRMTTYSLNLLLTFLSQSIVPCLILTIASCPAYRLLRR